MGVLAKVVYAFVIHFVIYWIFVQPFIGKDFSYSNAVSYSVGAIILLIFSTLSNMYMVLALLTGIQVDQGKCMYYYIINMTLADLIQTLIETPLMLFEHITLVSSNTGLQTIDLIVRNRKLIRQFTFLAGILYAATLAQYCFLTLLSTFVRVQRVTFKTAIVGLQLVWLYTVLCYTFDEVYTHEKGWKVFHNMTYTSMVELFVPLGFSIISIVGLAIMGCRRPYQQHDVPNKLMFVLVAIFCLFRAPRVIINLLQENGLNPSSYKMKKGKQIAANLYLLKYCTSPLALYIFDQSAEEMYDKLYENISKSFWKLRQQRQRGRTEASVKYDQSSEKINIAVSLEEEAELLPQT